MKCPLSTSQERLWFIDQFERGTGCASSPTYHNLAIGLRGTGGLDMQAASLALQQVLVRHSALRARVANDNGVAQQHILETAELHVTERDARGQSFEATLDQALAGVTKPFDLERELLLRADLYRFGAGNDSAEFLFLITAHQFVADQPTLQIVVEEFATLLRSRHIELPAPELSYSDFSEWQRSLPADALEPLLFYWKWQLRGKLAALALPSARRRPAVLTFTAGRHVLDLPAATIAALRALARAENVEPAAVAFAAFKVLLHRYARQDEIVIGTLVSGRDQPGTERLVGPAANLLILRGQLGANPEFRQVLVEVAKTLRVALEHRELPFDTLVRALNPEKDLSRSALCDVLFAYDDAPLASLELGVTSADVVALNLGAGKYDLNVSVRTNRDGGARGEVVFNADLYDADFIAQLMGHFVQVLNVTCETPTAQIGDLPLLSVAERQLVVRTWNDTPADYPQQFCLHELVTQQALRTPAAPAVTFEGVTISYAELDRRANQLAQWLVRAGVQRETLVGVCAERSTELVVALIAIMKAGGAYVPLDPAYPADRLAFMTTDANVTVLLTQNKFFAEVQTLVCSGATPVRVLRLDADWPEVAQMPGELPVTGVTPDHLAYMIYTSGSTGRPKGALNTHRAVINRLLWGQATYQFKPSDTFVQKTPFSFDVSVWEFFSPLLAGARLVVARPGGHQEPAYLAELAVRESVTIMHFVPSMLQVFVEEPGLANCTTLKRVFCSGEALPFELQERFFARHPAEVHNLYGPTEAAVEVTYWQCERGSSRPIVPIGRPISRIQMYVLDSRMQPVPLGVAGELYIGGIGVARGYHQRPELTAEKFVPDPFGVPGARLYRTGDLTRWLPDGVIEYLGRIDHQVKIRGFRIELGEIETALTQQAGVREAVVIVREDRPGQQRLAGYLVPTGTTVLNLEELRRALRTTLPDYMVPPDLVVLPALPLLPNGKVERQALPVPAVALDSAAGGYVAPRTPTEQKLAELFVSVLRRDRVGVHHNFFDLGGHSLLATQLVSGVRTVFGVELPLRHVFEAPTIEGLAGVVDERLRLGATGAASAPAITRAARRPRTPAVVS